jgi:hypothetical protein
MNAHVCALYRKQIAQKCIRIEVVWGHRSEAPVVKVWMPLEQGL